MRTVVIDPGHGGFDPGAVANGLLEKDVALDIARRVQRLTQRRNLDCILTRDSDPAPGTELSLERRCEISNAARADCFVSIHCNAASNPNAYGSETFFCRGSYGGAALARSIQGQFNQKVREIPERRVSGAGFYVLKYTDAPAALVECGFLTNTDDATLLKKEAVRQAIAQGISDGILEWLNAGEAAA